MRHHFNVLLSKDLITISKLDKNMYVQNISIAIDHYFIGMMSLVDKLRLSINNQEPKTLFIVADIILNGHLYRIHESYNLSQANRINRAISYKAGDILIGCDNINGLPYGYVGHAAIVINQEMIVESVITNPIVRKTSISSFIKDHPIHTHFRPKSFDGGQKAANYAINYLNMYEENKKQGVLKPVFKFTTNTPLHDEWTFIYCTKLIWLSYFYGMNYEFTNDHLWFAPEDLFMNLKENRDFELIYMHPDFKFHLDL